MPSIPRPLVDDAGEDDETFFSRRPHARTRLRLAWDFELPDTIVQAAIDVGQVGFVVVRRGPPGAPSRHFVFAHWGCA